MPKISKYAYNVGVLPQLYEQSCSKMQKYANTHGILLHTVVFQKICSLKYIKKTPKRQKRQKPQKRQNAKNADFSDRSSAVLPDARKEKKKFK